MALLDDEARHLALVLLRYCSAADDVSKSDCIMVLCSYDTRVANHAAKLYHEGWAGHLLFSGGLSDFTARIYDKSEADVFAEIALADGVPASRIIRENRSTNTGDNLRFTADLLRERGLNFDSFIMLQRPVMLRRVRATAEALWPGKRVVVTSHGDVSLVPNRHLNEEQFVHEIVGVMHRIEIYPALGFQSPQEIPHEVREAYRALVTRGFTGAMAR